MWINAESFKSLHAFLKWQAADTTFHTYNADALNNTLWKETCDRGRWWTKQSKQMWNRLQSLLSSALLYQGALPRQTQGSAAETEAGQQ